MISTLRIGYQPSTHQIAEMVASEKGWWAEDLKPFGITEIKEFEFPRSSRDASHGAGELDIAYVGTARPFLPYRLDCPPRSWLRSTSTAPDLVLRPDLVYNGPASLVVFPWHIPTRIDSGHRHEKMAHGERWMSPRSISKPWTRDLLSVLCLRTDRWCLPAASSAINN
jgi:hypothetical protein